MSVSNLPSSYREALMLSHIEKHIFPSKLTETLYYPYRKMLFYLSISLKCYTYKSPNLWNFYDRLYSLNIDFVTRSILDHTSNMVFHDTNLYDCVTYTINLFLINNSVRLTILFKHLGLKYPNIIDNKILISEFQ